jgi:uncharacterized RDD family membrane protein YckC
MAAIPATPPSSDPAAAATRARPDALTRFIAFFIDAVIVAAVGLVPIIGGLVGIAYVLVRDGLGYDFMDGRSIGKRIMKLRPIRLDGLPMDVETSIRRNWPLAFGSLAQVLIFVPVIGWILIPFVGIAGTVMVVVEVVRVLTGADGRRWGDTMAGTEVVVVAD